MEGVTGGGLPEHSQGCGEYANNLRLSSPCGWKPEKRNQTSESRGLNGTGNSKMESCQAWEENKTKKKKKKNSSEEKKETKKKHRAKEKGVTKKQPEGECSKKRCL